MLLNVFQPGHCIQTGASDHRQSGLVFHASFSVALCRFVLADRNLKGHLPKAQLHPRWPARGAVTDLEFIYVPFVEFRSSTHHCPCR